ncbi:MAG: cytidylate kinase-like family protein [Eubacteriales bacterium]|nr:cytidylate kinase-like family protein [Eubacteriales bacterium]
MEYTQEMLRELAERIYDLDAEVYAQLGSSLGRVFSRDREGCVQELVRLMEARTQGHQLRSELALISNMARTIQDKEIRKMVMTEYNRVLQEVVSLPTSFGEGDVVDMDLASLNALNLKNRFAETDHLIICIGRTYGSGGNEIGFNLADALKINFYDAEIFSAVLKRLEAEKDMVEDQAGYHNYSEKQKEVEQAFAPQRRRTLKECAREFSRYHGLSKQDAVFFNQSDLICDMARKESFIVMGRCADVILKNNRIPHISIFITAPFEQRLRRIMEINRLDEKKARKLLKKIDDRHRRYYQFYTGNAWGSAVNYDLCVNSAAYGIDGSVEFIKRMIVRGYGETKK